MPLSTLKNKVIASSALILHPLTWQSQADFVADLQDYGDGQQVRKTLRPTSLLFSSFAWNMWKKIQQRCFAWCDTSKEENRMKTTSAPYATHTQFISWTVWQQSNSGKKKKEQPTTAIKYQFAPTPLTCFLPAVCSLLLRGLFQTEVKVQFNFHL